MFRKYRAVDYYGTAQSRREDYNAFYRLPEDVRAPMYREIASIMFERFRDIWQKEKFDWGFGSCKALDVALDGYNIFLKVMMVNGKCVWVGRFPVELLLDTKLWAKLESSSKRT